MGKPQCGIVESLGGPSDLGRPHEPDNPVAQIVVLQQDEDREEQRESSRHQWRNQELQIFCSREKRARTLILNLHLDRSAILRLLFDLPFHLAQHFGGCPPKSHACKLVSGIVDLAAEIGLITRQLLGKRRYLSRQERRSGARGCQQCEHDQRHGRRARQLVILQPAHRRLQQEAEQASERQGDEKITRESERRDHESCDNKRRCGVADIRWIRWRSSAPHDTLSLFHTRVTTSFGTLFLFLLGVPLLAWSSSSCLELRPF